MKLPSTPAGLTLKPHTSLLLPHINSHYVYYQMTKSRLRQIWQTMLFVLNRILTDPGCGVRQMWYQSDWGVNVRLEKGLLAHGVFILRQGLMNGVFRTLVAVMLLIVYYIIHVGYCHTVGLLWDFNLFHHKMCWVLLWLHCLGFVTWLSIRNADILTWK